MLPSCSKPKESVSPSSDLNDRRFPENSATNATSIPKCSRAAARVRSTTSPEEERSEARAASSSSSRSAGRAFRSFGVGRWVRGQNSFRQLGYLLSKDPLALLPASRRICLLVDTKTFILCHSISETQTPLYPLLYKNSAKSKQNRHTTNPPKYLAIPKSLSPVTEDRSFSEIQDPI